MTKHRWQREEVFDLLKSWFILSLAFAILFAGFEFSLKLLVSFCMATITVGTGFLLHELAHKFLAEKYGCVAVYKANPLMLGITLISSLFGFIFAAPGGVYILGILSKKKNGIISLAGPMTNIILALVFLATSLLASSEIITSLSSIGFFINAWLGAFNMIPFGPFDGKKVWEWNKAIYVASTSVAVGLVFLRFMM
ncbi:MAG: metalloprotease [Candidatus Woesearchaeota archaeon]